MSGNSGPNQELDIGTWKLGAPEAKDPLNKPHMERRNKVFQAIPSPVSTPHHPHTAPPETPINREKDSGMETETHTPSSPHTQAVSHFPSVPAF